MISKIYEIEKENGLKKDQFNIIIDNNLHTGEICEIPFV